MKQPSLITILFTLALVLSRILPASGNESALAQRLSATLTAGRLGQIAYGVHVETLKEGKTLFSKNAQLPLNPASSLKLLIAATALKKLGTNYRFNTWVKQSGKDLCLVGGGDPSLVTETIYLLSEEVRKRGIRKIEGDLFADSTFFTSSRNHLHSFEADEGRAFTAPVSSLSANFNSLTVQAFPGKIGSPARIELDPPISLFELSNRTKTAATAVKQDLGAILEPLTDNRQHMRVNVWGKVTSQTESTTIYRAVPFPEIYAASMFLEQFERQGGSFSGKIKSETCPSEAREILKFESKPLSQIVFDMNKFSNNFIAEMLLRAVGTQPITEDGLKAIREWLTFSGIPAPELDMENASGLSRNTKISVQTLTRVIRAAANDFSIGPEFVASLGIFGVDGTLKRRLKNSNSEMLARAKSGQLDRVVSLAGIALTPEEGQVAFAFMFNMETDESYRMQLLENDLVRAMVEGGRETSH